MGGGGLTFGRAGLSFVGAGLRFERSGRSFYRCGVTFFGGEGEPGWSRVIRVRDFCGWRELFLADGAAQVALCGGASQLALLAGAGDPFHARLGGWAAVAGWVDLQGGVAGVEHSVFDGRASGFQTSQFVGGDEEAGARGVFALDDVAHAEDAEAKGANGFLGAFDH